jgi:hypothetical protein
MKEDERNDRKEGRMSKMNPVVHFEMPYENRNRMADSMQKLSVGNRICSVPRWEITSSWQRRKVMKKRDAPKIQA